MIQNGQCGNCFGTGLDHRGRYCECRAEPPKHEHRWIVEDSVGHYEYWYCRCGELTTVYVD